VAACAGPKCDRPPLPGRKFCPVCNAAPATQKGGWLSAAKRRQATVSKVDASNVAPRLWVGGKVDPTAPLTKVSVLVLCAQEIQPTQLAFQGEVLRCPIPDSRLTLPEFQRAVATSSQVAHELAGGKTVLVTCAKGFNRSALVASMALGKITRLSADDLIALMRAKRSRYCLSNPHFRQILQRVVGAGRGAPVNRPRA
jgi:protein-tyrosine phosphatase